MTQFRRPKEGGFLIRNLANLSVVIVASLVKFLGVALSSAITISFGHNHSLLSGMMRCIAAVRYKMGHTSTAKSTRKKAHRCHGRTMAVRCCR